MSPFLKFLAIALPLGASAGAMAADAVVMLPIQGPLEGPRAREHIDRSILLFFGDQATPRVTRNFGEYVSNRKTNGFLKGEASSCDWAFISALKSLQERAREVGANAVIKIHSYYKKQDVSSEANFECHKGMLMAGVALRGEMVTVGR